MTNRQNRRAAEKAAAKRSKAMSKLPPIPAISGDEAKRCDKCQNCADTPVVNICRKLVNVPLLEGDDVLCMFNPQPLQQKTWGYCSQFKPKE